MTLDAWSRRSLAAAAVAALTLLPSAPAPASHLQTRATADACAHAPEDGFTDTGREGSATEEAVDCIAWYRITGGTSRRTYAPTRRITRAQMASMLAAKLRQAVKDLAEAGPGENFFVDDRGNPHEADINFVAKHRVATGTGGARFSPGSPVSRAQMASFLVNQLRALDAPVPGAGGESFLDDDGSVHEHNINTLAGLGIVAGRREGFYEPRGTVTRGQMALFLARDLDYLVEQGQMLPPNRRGGFARTAAPELLDVELVTETQPDHVLLRFSFDEEVTGKPPATDDPAFHLYSFDAARRESVAPEGKAKVAVDRQRRNAVLVWFAAADYAEATTAAVAVDAVRDAENVSNPEGQVAVQGLLFPAGITDAPDLQQVRAADPFDPDAPVVDFVFDEPVASIQGTIPMASLQDTAGFELVLSSGEVIASRSASPQRDRRVVRVTFSAGIGDQAVQRAHVAPATVGDGAPPLTDPRAAGGRTNPLQSVDWPRHAGLTAAPDLVEVGFDPAGTEPDRVTYTFDAAVTLAAGKDADGLPVTPEQVPDPARWNLYEARGREIDAQGVEVAGERRLVASFPDGALETAVGASVEAAAVTAAAADAANDAGELPRQQAVVVRPLATTAPDLVSVQTMLQGSAAVVTLTFDDLVATTAAQDPANYALYDLNGRRTVLQGNAAVSGRTVSIRTSQAAAVSAARLVGVRAGTVADGQGHGNYEATAPA